ncbi:hypothetical protein RvY_09949 [Ramazzottius varieornatus]|uniref:Signal transducing adapter molecule 1 n=1 Tax=Ramazzottius varieornatus TaxID=947166 RepID=A0A1D1VDI5_RAMVA|nr:hypothetical protein RvY_09949 [Ramazzottius varieornatus]
MGLFGANATTLEQTIDVATDGKKVTENWADILEIVDQIDQQPNGAKDALKAIMKRVKHKDPHVAMLALTLLDACVTNAKKKFHLEVSSRYFEDEVKSMLNNSNNYNYEVVEKLCTMIKKWSENEFRSDPQLTLIPSLFAYIRTTRPSFAAALPASSKAAPQVQQTSVRRTSDVTDIQRKEEDDLAKAIALSIAEEEKKKLRSSSASSGPSGSGGPSASLYPSMNDRQASSSRNDNAIYATIRKEPKEPRKVRAMYDFEAVEDNELTFKAGEVILVVDDSDPNWWKGTNSRGEGLFPTNFVTSDLNWQPEVFAEDPKKKISEEVASLTSGAEKKPVVIDEELIDRTLNVIHDADPEGVRPDPADLLELEDQCTRMWPLIDAELQKVDRLQSGLEEISTQINDALAMYDSVMKEQAAQFGQVQSSLPYAHSAHHTASATPVIFPPVGTYNAPVPGEASAAQYIPQQMLYQNHPQQQIPQLNHDFSAMAINSGVPQPPQTTAFQTYVPNPAKLAAAAGQMAQQQLPQLPQVAPTYSQPPTTQTHSHYAPQ